MSDATPANTLQLDPVAGPSAATLELAPRSTPWSVGRSPGCDHVLSSEAVSRRHAAFAHMGGRWLVWDLQSRHGTLLNGDRLEADVPRALGEGDLIELGPYHFRVQIGPRGARPALTTTTDDRASAVHRVERVSDRELDLYAQRRLHLLVDCAAKINIAEDDRSLAEAVLQCALDGTGFQHAALLRPLSGTADEIQVVGHLHRAGIDDTELSYSRSLITAASGGQLVRLTEPAQFSASQSIAALGITSAVCAPIMLGPSVDTYLYLDARGRSESVATDEAGFCQVLARLCGLALANLRREELEQRERAMRDELNAARQAQKLIVPGSEGALGGLRFAAQMRPGRFVAGDLFDVIDCGDGRVAVCIGDVSGKGIEAAVIMVALQSHLHAALRRTHDPARAVRAVNRYITARSPDEKFASLWVGVFDLAAGSLTYVDAGHGHWLMYPHGGVPVSVKHDGAILVGIEPDFPYESETLAISSGDRLVLYSDGAPEQPALGGERFGQERLIEALRDSAGVAEDVRRIIDAVQAFAGRTSLDDDTTVASVEVGEESDQATERPSD